MAYKREKDCAVEELIKAQDTIGRLKLEKSTKSIDLYDPNNPDILQKKLSNIFNSQIFFTFKSKQDIFFCTIWFIECEIKDTEIQSKTRAALEIPN